MESKLDISIFQIDLAYKDKEANLNLIKKLSNKISKTDLILLPEMFNTSFITDDINISEDMNGPTVSWMRSLAEHKKCSVAGTILIKQENHFYNRLIWVNNDQQIFYYDKSHLFSLANEDKHISKGKNKIIINLNGWKICPLICYDIRFPVFCRNTENYDVLIFLSSWPEKRIDAWDVLLKARSIENQCYAIGVNRTGKDNNGFLFPGHSSVYDSLGNTLLDLSTERNVVKKITLDKNELSLRRRQLQFLKDMDDFKISQ